MEGPPTFLSLLRRWISQALRACRPLIGHKATGAVKFGMLRLFFLLSLIAIDVYIAAFYIMHPLLNILIINIVSRSWISHPHPCYIPPCVDGFIHKREKEQKK
jgi:hypothetical protein